MLRLAVPPRHARVETGAAAPSQPAPPARRPPRRPTRAGWARLPGRAGVPARRSPTGGRPRAVWSALPGEDWPARLAEAVAATVAGGRGALVVVPDARDLDRLDAALTAVLGPGRHVALSADLGPAERYRRLLRGPPRARCAVVVGTRAAAFAPVADLGLVAIWDDGDDLHAEPRAPYPHAREVLLARAQLAGAGALVGGYARTAEAQLLVETGWAQRDRRRPGGGAGARRRAVAPTGDDAELARDPARRHRPAAQRWPGGPPGTRWPAGAPVLVQVPRRGYLPSVACAECRTPARCPHCAGPLALRSAHARRRPAAGAAGRPAAYACPRLRRPAAAGRRWSAPGAPPRSWAGRSRACRCGPPGATACSTDGARPGRRWWWPRRAPSRWPTAATARCCCWTAGRC